MGTVLMILIPYHQLLFCNKMVTVCSFILGVCLRLKNLFLNQGFNKTATSMHKVDIVN